MGLQNDRDNRFRRDQILTNECDVEQTTLGVVLKREKNSNTYPPAGI